MRAAERRNAAFGSIWQKRAYRRPRRCRPQHQFDADGEDDALPAVTIGFLQRLPRPNTSTLPTLKFRLSAVGPKNFGMSRRP